MDDKAKVLKRVEFITRPYATLNSQTVKSERKDDFNTASRPVIHSRFILNLTTIFGQNNSLDYLLASDRAPLPTSSIIHPISKEHHQENCCTDTQDTEHQKLESTIRTNTKSTESKIPQFHPEQSRFRKAIRFLIILFIILGVFYLIVIGSQTGYVDVGAIARSWDHLIQKLRLTRRFNPPI